MKKDILECYSTGQRFVGAWYNNSLVLNDTVLPIWLNDNQHFYYRREKSTGYDYVLVNASMGTKKIAFDHQALATALEKFVEQDVDPQKLPIYKVTLELDPVKVNFEAFKKKWIYDTESGKCLEVEKFEAEAVVGKILGRSNEFPKADREDLHLASACGEKEVYVKDSNLWLRDIDTGEERQLTNDGGSDFGYSGSMFGLDVSVPARWSPDSKKLFAVKLDKRGITERPMYDFAPTGSDVRPQKASIKLPYPRDESIYWIELAIIDVESGKVCSVDYDAMAFLFTEGDPNFFTMNLGFWSADCESIYFYDYARDGTYVRLVKADAQNGETSILIEETSTTYLNIRESIAHYPTFQPLLACDELIWYSERTGRGHLYLYELSTGTLKYVLTEGDWDVRSILHCDQIERTLIIQTAGRDPNVNPYYRDVCKLDLDKREIITLSGGSYEYNVHRETDMISKEVGFFGHGDGVTGISRDGRYIVYTRSRVDMFPESFLMDADGNQILALETCESSGLQEDWVWPEPVKLKATDGKTPIYGVVFRPPGFSPDQSYPVIEAVWSTKSDNGMPAGSFINTPFMGLPYLLAAGLSALGFIVVIINGRGTPLRGVAFRDCDYGDPSYATNVQDRMAGLKQLADKYMYMDLSRLGVTAPEHVPHAAAAIVHHSDFYKVAVQHGFLDPRATIAQVGEVYDGMRSRANLEDHRHPEYNVDNFEGKLLFCTGMKGVCEGTFRLVEALQQANKDFDMLIMPNMLHQMIGYTIRREWDYFVINLRNMMPPKEFRLLTQVESGASYLAEYKAAEA